MAKKEPPKIVKLSTVPIAEFISTGVDELDKIIMFPRGRISLLYGSSGTGKTDLMLKCAIRLSQEGGRVLYIDVENRLNPKRLEALGGDLTKIDYSRVYVLQEVAEIIRGNIGKYDLMVLDSIAQMVPAEEKSAETGEHLVGLRPRIHGQWLRQVLGPLAETKCALVLINQMRKNIGGYGDPFYLPGGEGFKFNSTISVQLISNNSSDKILKGSELVGRKVHAKVMKSNLGEVREDGNRFAFLHQEAHFKLMF